MKNAAIFVLALGLIKGACSVNLEGIPSYAVVNPEKDTSVHLICRLQGIMDPGKEIFFSWLNPSNLIWAFTETYADTRVTSSWSKGMQEMDLNIKSVALSDQGQYTCQFTSGAVSDQATVQLLVNQLPTLHLRKDASVVLEGELTRVASCFANLSKPAPEMWFEDSDGDRVDTQHTVERVEGGKGLTNSTLHLEREFVRSDSQKTIFCRVKHINQTEPSSMPIGNLDVKYSPVAAFTSKDIGRYPQVFEEGSSFSVGCQTEGFPEPTVTWSFRPSDSSQTLEEEDGESLVTDVNLALPLSFIVTDDGHRIITTSLSAEDTNGTYTCHVTNDVGADSASFALLVYALPTTPAPTTPAFPWKNADAAATTPEPEGLHPAVLAGVVVGALLLLIIVFIILLRFYLAHKGEYFTNEKKSTYDDVKEVEDDDESAAEVDLLAARREHIV